MSEIAKGRYLDMLSTAMGAEIMMFLQDDQVIEIMLNPDGQLVVERLRQGKQLTGHYIPPSQSENIIKLVAAYKNQITDSESPEVATEIPFRGARFQGWLPPVVSQPTFAIRKRALQIFSLQAYVDAGTLTQSVCNYLQQAVKARKNVMIVGGTGSGKTTFANALLAELAGCDDRILVIEDLPELQLKAKDVVHMVTTPQVTMRDLVKGSLRMRPDRIIIGEVRDGSALELLKGWNTGHPGGVCTLHANSAESAPLRLEDLIQEVVVTVPRNLITQAIDLIVFIERGQAGQRHIRQICELSGYHNGHYQLKAINF